MGIAISNEEIRGLPVPKEVQDLMIQAVNRVRLLEREVAGNIELAYWRGKQEQSKECKSLASTHIKE